MHVDLVDIREIDLQRRSRLTTVLIPTFNVPLRAIKHGAMRVQHFLFKEKNSHPQKTSQKQVVPTKEDMQTSTIRRRGDEIKVS